MEALLALGEIRLDEGQLKWTRVLAERALLLAPNDARVHDLLGKLDAAERCEKGRKRFPRNWGLRPSDSGLSLPRPNWGDQTHGMLFQFGKR